MTIIINPIVIFRFIYQIIDYFPYTLETATSDQPLATSQQLLVIGLL